jgi:murein DD-endopeptidase MepM/ murein hydrolase activator NlpD
MKTLWGLLALLLAVVPSRADDSKGCTLEERKNGRVVEVVAVNRHPWPILIDFSFSSLRNCVPGGPGSGRFVCAPETSVTVGVLLIQNLSAPYSYRESAPYLLLSSENTESDIRGGFFGFSERLPAPTEVVGDYVYRLPYEVGKTFPVSQGYNGPYTHQGINAIDFALPFGSSVCAAREGVVLACYAGAEDTKEGANENPGCNFVYVLHADGTTAMYAHIKRGSLRVQAGDTIIRGQRLALSGNNGKSSGPHLHFEVSVVTNGKPRTIETIFGYAGKGQGILTEGMALKAGY